MAYYFDSTGVKTTGVFCVTMKEKCQYFFCLYFLLVTKLFQNEWERKISNGFGVTEWHTTSVSVIGGWFFTDSCWSWFWKNKRYKIMKQEEEKLNVLHISPDISSCLSRYWKEYNSKQHYCSHLYDESSKWNEDTSHSIDWAK